MILPDTSVWINHFRMRHAPMMAALIEGTVVLHPFVVGELACGDMPDRSGVLRMLQKLPTLAPATHDEVLALIELRQLSGTGIGYIDAHLLASALISRRVKLWTHDKRLAAIAAKLEVGYGEP